MLRPQEDDMLWLAKMLEAGQRALGVPEPGPALNAVA